MTYVFLIFQIYAEGLGTGEHHQRTFQRLILEGPGLQAWFHLTLFQRKKTTLWMRIKKNCCQQKLILYWKQFKHPKLTTLMGAVPNHQSKAICNKNADENKYYFSPGQIKQRMVDQHQHRGLGLDYAHCLGQPLDQAQVTRHWVFAPLQQASINSANW